MSEVNLVKVVPDNQESTITAKHRTDQELIKCLQYPSCATFQSTTLKLKRKDLHKSTTESRKLHSVIYYLICMLQLS